MINYPGTLNFVYSWCSEIVCLGMSLTSPQEAISECIALWYIYISLYHVNVTNKKTSLFEMYRSRTLFNLSSISHSEWNFDSCVVFNNGNEDNTDKEIRVGQNVSA